ncbi:MAG: DUF4197 domain-containing protein [Bacteroidales bacterium]|nr:DUF4197 domain-containing protein [Bacteroidales bacterium]
MKKIFISIIVAASLLAGCEWLEDNLPEGLTDGEIIEGLKTALNVGTDTASGTLSLRDGYYGNPLVKIPLPPEVAAIRDEINSNTTLASISSTIGLENTFEKVIYAVNRSAEDAARDAAPIFKNAITNLTISQGWDILHGTVPSKKSTAAAAFDSTAATKYLMNETYDPLTALYAPKINASLDKDLIADVSATEAWSSLTTTYNSFMGRSDVQTAITLANLLGSNIDLPASINSNLGEFSTQKALDGLFFKVGNEEIKIRRDPWKWATTTVGNILTKVFGSDD